MVTKGFPLPLFVYYANESGYGKASNTIFINIVNIYILREYMVT